MNTTHTMQPGTTQEGWLSDAAKIAGALATVSAGLFGYLKLRSKKSVQTHSLKRFSAGNNAIKVMYDVMEEAVHHAKLCDRAIVFAAHNDGGWPRIGSPYFASAIHWAASKPENYKRIADYTELSVDSAYCRMVGEMIEKGFVVLDYDTMEPGLLKDIYTTEGVCQSLLVFLGLQDRKLIYMGFAKLNENGAFRVGEISRLKIAAHTVANELLK